MRWGDQHRPVGRWIPRALVDRFDVAANWLDGEIVTWRGQRVERWDVLNVIVGLISSVIYSIYLGSWLRGMTLGPLMYAMGYIAFRWMSIL